MTTSPATPGDRFRSAYWQAVRDLDVIRLRQWERWHVTLPQLRVLFQLRRSPGITTVELAPLLGIAVSTTSGLIAKLADRGLVERGALPHNRRQIPLRLTAQGEALAGALQGPSAAFLDTVLLNLGDDVAPVAAALEQLARAAQAVRAVEPPPASDAMLAAQR
jgi:DNA-binding MarR family transcriptional regulator